MLRPPSPLRATAALLLAALATTAQAQERPADEAVLLPVLSMLSASTQGEAMLTRVAIQGDSVQLRGLALSHQLVAQLLEQLDASPTTEQVIFVSSETEQHHSLDLKAFTLELRLTPQPAPEPSQALEADRFVPPRKIPSLLSRVNTEARRRGLRFIRFMPLPEVQRGAYLEVPVEIELEGSFEQLLGLLDSLAQAPRAWSWRDVEIEALQPFGAQTSLRFRGQLLAYRLADPDQLPSLAPTTPGDLPPVEGWRDPFGSFIQPLLQKLEDTPPIARYGLDQFSLVSLDCVAQRAVIADPTGARYPIGLGDFVGADWGQVIELRCPSVVVSQPITGPDGEALPHQVILELPLPVGEQQAD
jgi:hypothetical protein